MDWNRHFRNIGVDMEKAEADSRYSADDRALELDILIRYLDGELDEDENADDIRRIEEEFMAEPHMPGVIVADQSLVMAYVDELAYRLYKDYTL